MIDAVSRRGASVARLGACAGLAAAIVPCTIAVHLGAEAAAVWRGGLDAAFVFRHLYLALALVASLYAFAAAAGLDRAGAERRRRCALIRAQFRAGGWFGLRALLVLNLGTFALTQVLEGVPIAAGALALSLLVAVAGSLAAALVIMSFGRALAVAALDAVIGEARRHAQPRPIGHAVAVGAARRVAVRCRLVPPSRPPPSLSHI